MSDSRWSQWQEAEREVDVAGIVERWSPRVSAWICLVLLAVLWAGIVAVAWAVWP
jgi:hypothetical protein